jgi:predicted DNA-binding protein with PD1-like motif
MEKTIRILSMAADDGSRDGDGGGVSSKAVTGTETGSAMGGHLLKAHVRPTLEVVLTESPRHLHKRKDAESGLALIAAEE